MSFFTKLPEDRYDANALRAFQAGTDFTLANAKSCAWLSQLAYETDEPDKISRILRLGDMELVPDGVFSKEVETVLPIAATHGFVARGRGFTVVAFAGTDPVVLANWITDFDARLSHTGAAEGYKRAAEAIWPAIKSLVEAPGAANRKVYVTGHSLGGALAALTAFRLDAEQVAPLAAVYTIGMPRAGDAAYAAAYNARIGLRTFRLVHGDDVVPTVAPSELKFRHVGRYLHCDRGGKFDEKELAGDTNSDDPQFVPGVSKELHGFWHAPLSSASSFIGRIELASKMALGQGPAGARSDWGGIAIELLPPRIRDHMPDRYIGAL